MIGDILRQERERQHLTIKDIERGTSIRGLYIEAIEQGEYATLPGDVYTKGFIRNYANFLKIDADDCVKRYVMENHPDQTPAEPVQADVHRQESGTVQEDRESFSHREAPNTHREAPKRKSGASLVFGVVFALAAVAALLGGAWFLLSDNTVAHHSSTSKPQVRQEKKTEPLKAEKVPVAKQEASAEVPASPEKSEPVPAPAAPTEKKADGIQVTATFTDRCWTRVVADGQTVYEGTAEQGKTMSWKGTEKVTVTAGNAGAMELTHNGKSIGKAGETGQVVDKVFTKDSVN